MKLDIDCEPILIYPSGVNKSVGHAEFKQTEFDVRITQVNMTNFTVMLLRGNVTEQYLYTNYIGNFKSSTYVINTALMFLLEWLNEEFFTSMTFDLAFYTLGLFKWNQTFLGYNDGYMSFGFTLDFRNSTLFEDKKPLKSEQQTLEARPEWIEAEAQRQQLLSPARDTHTKENKAFLGRPGKRWIEAEGITYYIDEEEDFFSDEAFMNIE